MTIEEIRQKNILYWAEKLGRGTLADKIGYKDTIYINQLCGGHGSFGSRTARKIEKRLGLPQGWFDQEHDASTPKDKLDLIFNKIKDWDDSRLAEIEAQIDLIKRRHEGLL